MIVLVLGSTLCAARARSSAGAPRWWALYAGVHVRRGLHALHERVRARGPARLGAVGASRGAPAARSSRPRPPRSRSCPGSPACAATWTSPTTDILSALQPFTRGFVRTALVALGDRLPVRHAGARRRRRCPAFPLWLLAAAVALGCGGPGARARCGRRPRMPEPRAGAGRRARRRGPGRRGARRARSASNLFGTRNLAASWPAFALCLAALLLAAGPRLGLAAAALAIGAFAIGGLQDARPATSRGRTSTASAAFDRPRGAARATSWWTARASPAGRADGARRRARRRRRDLPPRARRRRATTRSGSLALAPPTASRWSSGPPPRRRAVGCSCC